MCACRFILDIRKRVVLGIRHIRVPVCSPDLAVLVRVRRGEHLIDGPVRHLSIQSHYRVIISLITSLCAYYSQQWISL